MLKLKRSLSVADPLHQKGRRFLAVFPSICTEPYKAVMDKMNAGLKLACSGTAFYIHQVT